MERLVLLFVKLREECRILHCSEQKHVQFCFVEEIGNTQKYAKHVYQLLPSGEKGTQTTKGVRKYIDLRAQN